MKNRGKTDNNYLLALLSIFVILAAGVIAAGYAYYSGYSANYRSQVENQLSSIADLKTGELAHWRNERMGDAALFYQNPIFADLVRRYLGDGADADAEAQLTIWLRRFQDSGQYERVMLLDTGYVKKIVVPEAPEHTVSYVSPGTDEKLQSGQVAFEDFYFDDVNHKIYLKVMVPIFDPADDRHIIGFCALRIDPTSYLYPTLQRWPTPSATAETLIVRRDGEDVLYLNELRFQKGTALKLRFPLDRIELPTVRGVLGYEGVTEGRDYRGEEVIATVRSVPDSPWILVARIDTAEVYAPLTQMLWIVLLLVGSLLLGAGTGVGLVWRQRIQLFYRERIKSAEALRASEEKYRRIVEAGIEGIIQLDNLARITFVNAQTALMLGYTIEELTGRELESYVADADIEDHRAQMRLRALGKDAVYERHFRRKEGATLWAIVSARVIYDADGRRQGSFAMITDITERKRAEEEAHRLAEVVRHSIEMVNLATPEGKMIFLNDAGLEMLGIDPQDVDKYDIMQFVPDHLTEKVQSELLPALLEGGTWSGDLQYVNLKTRLLTDVHATTFAIKDPATGAVQYLANVSLDITRRKHMENRLKEAVEGLQSSNAELERFTYTISHDLRSPLVTVKTFLGYLRQDIGGTDAGKVEKDMLFMEGASDKMSRMLDELLEMSRIGRVVNTPVKVTFDELVQEALGIVAGRMRERAVEVLVSDGRPLTLLGDRPRLVEVWQNLLENAVKFMGGQTSPRIDIGVEGRGKDTVFFVRDNGIGIDPRYKSRVFNLFDKLDAKAEGTGLGLAIVRKIVEMYKGTAWLESDGPGRGSCFFFTLPAAVEDADKGGSA